MASIFVSSHFNFSSVLFRRRPGAHIAESRIRLVNIWWCNLANQAGLERDNESPSCCIQIWYILMNLCCVLCFIAFCLLLFRRELFYFGSRGGKDGGMCRPTLWNARHSWNETFMCCAAHKPLSRLWRAFKSEDRDTVFLPSFFSSFRRPEKLGSNCSRCLENILGPRKTLCSINITRKL
jgi:hypothetical protein